VLISKYLPEVGARSPFVVWSSYAALGLLCGMLMFVYRHFALKREAVV